MTFTAFDFETANNASNSACQLGVVKVENGKIIKKQSWYIRPPSQLFLHTRIHGISWNDVRFAPDFSELWKEIEPYFTTVDFAVAHNVRFDRTVMKSCCDHYGLSFPDIDYRCSVELTRNVMRVKKANLANVCSILNIPLDHHEALSDAVGCAKITIHCMNEMSGKGSFSRVAY